MTESTTFRESTFVCYDLRNEEAWGRASRDREAWGREMTVIHTLDNNHIIVEFLAGGTLETSA
jgi:hypothetical protein